MDARQVEVGGPTATKRGARFNVTGGPPQLNEGMAMLNLEICGPSNLFSWDKGRSCRVDGFKASVKPRA